MPTGFIRGEGGGPPSGEIGSDLGFARGAGVGSGGSLEGDCGPGDAPMINRVTACSGLITIGGSAFLELSSITWGARYEEPVFE